MVKKFYVSIDLLGENALLNALWIELEPTSTAPGSPLQGMLYYFYDSGGDDNDNIPYFYDGSAWQPIYHFQGSTTALGATPADDDLFLIYDTSASGFKYKYVTWEYIKPSTGYWSRSSGDGYLYPTTTTDDIILAADSYLVFGTFASKRAELKHNDTADRMELHAYGTDDILLQVADSGASIAFTTTGGTIYLDNAALYTADSFTIGSSGNVWDAAYIDLLYLQNGAANAIGITTDAPTSGYTLTLPNATPTATQVLVTNSGTPTTLEWLTLTNHAAVTIHADLQDVLDISGQVINAAAAVTAGDIIYATADDNWGRLAKSTNGYILALDSGFPSWQLPTGMDIAMGYSEDFDTTSGAIGAWSGAAAPYVYTISFADLNTATGIVITNEGGYDIQVFELTSYGADPVYTEVEVAVTMDHTNDNIVFFASTKFSGYISIQKLAMV